MLFMNRVGALLRAVSCIGPLLAGAPLSAQDPAESPHGALRIECVECHGPAAWTPVRISRKFRHGRLGFPLEGAHRTTPCLACHANLEFAGTPATCASCHSDVHRGELGPDCARCHTPRSFVDRSAVVRLHQVGRFALAGAHLAADCTSCHPATGQGHLQFRGQPTDCFSCHRQQYQSARDPDHQAGGFSTECRDCHAVGVWTSARFNHDAVGFNLTGAHRAVACNQCHVGFRFTGTAANCVGCHQVDFDQAAAPNHVQSGFPTDCTTCHTTVSWQGSYDHSRTSFPLTGAHKAAGCLDCHADGSYRGKATTCVSCHQAAYDQTTNPNHRSAGFPVECAACHRTTGWDGAAFDHDGRFFPIYSGRHRQAWTTCADCHTNPASFAEFTCITCHTRSSTDGHHREVRSYQYVSTECLRCHPRGTGGD
jgi:hypothetical protein